MLTSRMKIQWVKEESGTKELELGCLFTKESSIYCGQLHFDPASESEYANPRNQDITKMNYSQVAKRHE